MYLLTFPENHCLPLYSTPAQEYTYKRFGMRSAIKHATGLLISEPLTDNSDNKEFHQI